MEPKKILVVDDDPDLLATLKRWLESEHFNCLIASNVETALELLRTDRPDLVILDLGFARINGTAFLRNASEWLPRGVKMPPVIVLSGYTDKEIVEYVLKMGAKGFIAKPYEIETLVSMVHDYISEETPLHH